MATSKLAQITEQDLRDHIASSGPELRRQYPKIYGFLGGLAGTAPDEFEGSVLDPISQAVKEGASYGFPIGVAAAVAPFAKGIAAAKGLATGGKAAQKGMLRLGGREDLIASHGIPYANNLLDASGKLIPELSHMSLAIERGGLRNPYAHGDSGIMLIPRAGKFDPRTSPSTIHMGDAYTPTNADARVNNLAPSTYSQNELARLRLQDRFETQWPRGGAGAADDELNNSLSTQRFNSFKGFESSPQGADMLVLPRHKWPLYTPEEQRFATLLEAVAEENSTGQYEALQHIMQAPGKTFAGFDKHAMFKRFARKPEAYAELKNFGQTQLTPDTFAGALIQPSSAKLPADVRDALTSVRYQLHQRGIPVRPLLGSSIQDFQTATELQRRAR